MSAKDMPPRPRQPRSMQHKMQNRNRLGKKRQEEYVKERQRAADSPEKFHMQQQTIIFVFSVLW